MCPQAANVHSSVVSPELSVAALPRDQSPRRHIWFCSAAANPVRAWLVGKAWERVLLFLLVADTVRAYPVSNQGRPHPSQPADMVATVVRCRTQGQGRVGRTSRSDS